MKSAIKALIAALACVGVVALWLVFNWGLKLLVVEEVRRLAREEFTSNYETPPLPPDEEPALSSDSGGYQIIIHGQREGFGVIDWFGSTAPIGTSDEDLANAAKYLIGSANAGLPCGSRDRWRVEDTDEPQPEVK